MYIKVIFAAYIECSATSVANRLGGDSVHKNVSKKEE